MNYGNLLNWIGVFFMNLSEFYTHEYVTKSNAFTRKRKLDLNDVINYVLVQKGRTNAVEAYEYVKHFKINKNKFRVSRQAIGKKRQLINPIIYFVMNKVFIYKIYEDITGLKKYKGYLLMSIDGTELKLPNKKETKEFRIKIHSLLKKALNRLKMSCVVDSYSHLIIDVLIDKKGASEVKLAIKHIKRLAKRGLNLKQTIFIADRGYNSLELMLLFLKSDSHFVIRLKKNMFTKERNKMRTKDEFIKIGINQKRLRNTGDLKILKIIAKTPFINLRITEIILPNGQKEILVSNLSIKKFSSEDLKEIYRCRWKIETVYDFLKNVIHIENFTGYNPIIIKQDIYTSILFYNLAMAIKIYTVDKLQKEKRLKRDYSVSFNFIAGILKIESLSIISSKTINEKLFILKDLVEELSYNKIKINKTKRKEIEFINSDNNNKFHMNRRIATL